MAGSALEPGALEEPQPAIAPIATASSVAALSARPRDASARARRAGRVAVVLIGGNSGPFCGPAGRRQGRSYAACLTARKRAANCKHLCRLRSCTPKCICGARGANPRGARKAQRGRAIRRAATALERPGGRKCADWVALWERVGYVRAQRAGVEGLLPLLHLGSVINLELQRGPLSWHLRPYARRKEPPHGARALPRGARRGGRARDAGRPQGVRRRVAPGGVRGLHAPRARRAAAAVAAAGRARALLLRQLARRRARRGRARS